MKYVYHKDIGFPTSVPKPRGRFILEYTRHALEEAQRDRYGPVVDLPRTLDCSAATLIELTCEGTKPTIAVFRQPHTADYDLVLVVALDKRRVVSLWLNHKHDTHKTLNTARYTRP